MAVATIFHYLSCFPTTIHSCFDERNAKRLICLQCIEYSKETTQRRGFLIGGFPGSGIVQKIKWFPGRSPSPGAEHRDSIPWCTRRVPHLAPDMCCRSAKISLFRRAPPDISNIETLPRLSRLHDILLTVLLISLLFSPHLCKSPGNAVSDFISFEFIYIYIHIYIYTGAAAYFLNN